ncbi:CDP-glucose 4,6-dehydratase [Paenibacillus sp. MWE-103]|uniref:CDP-glucose 4,6-dehydratase n=1 Tax=Paenibacillus artemisiicola TaxID=1172618 RepID=A0ABS3WFZ9_9BACL|nr:CDP-glucose 4,6-dehydratase [Paenibacillus artemisiicola]MBO7747243.1 CDP-glucose 4,6-dehydratase [Paenibacillus artemisiicola]
MTTASFWKDKKVLVTGHTGFKGTWLSLYLQLLGAKVYGYGFAPEPGEQLYTLTGAAEGMDSEYGDITDYASLRAWMERVRPEIVLHLAAQPLVRASYHEPVNTFATNVMGTVHVLEAARSSDSVRAIVNVTSDKCYDNADLNAHAFQEDERMGGSDPYSASKGCAELVTSSYIKSFFSHSDQALASARAGNVIGGGDFAKDRIIPDLIRSAEAGRPLVIRYPRATRPWQHVLDCLYGYLTLAEKLWKGGQAFAGGWNFGPDEQSVLSVSDLIERGRSWLHKPVDVHYETISQPYEAKNLMLSSQKARSELDWLPKLNADEAIAWTIEWYNRYLDGQAMKRFTMQQIESFIEKEAAVHVQPGLPLMRRAT